MLEKIKSKWVLIVIGVLLVIIVVIFLILSQNKTPSTETAQTSATPVSDEPTQYSELPQGTGGATGTGSAVTGLPTATVSAEKSKTATSPTPQPNPTGTVGYLDWSKNLSHYQTIPVTLSTEDTAKISSGDYCAMAGIADDWKDPFAKTMCGVARFVGKQIVEPLDRIACQLEISTLALNYSSSINGRYVNGLCLIEDR